MKVLRNSRLWQRKGSKEQFYDVELVDTENAENEARFVVNVRYGLRGLPGREATKTAEPVKRDEAEQIFDSVLIAKVNDGYRRVDGSDPFANAGEEQGEAGSAGAEIAEGAAEGAEKVLLARLAANLKEAGSQAMPDRLFWRIGELRLASAAPLLLQYAERIGAGNISYCLVWALARVAGGQAIHVMQAAAKYGESPLTKGLADFASISPLMGEHRLPPAQDETLPQSIIEAIAANDANALTGAFLRAAEQEPVRASAILVGLYRQAQSNAELYANLPVLLRQLPVRPPYIPGLRRLLKYSEMADDALIFGAAAQRFETTSPMYRPDPYMDSFIDTWDALGRHKRIELRHLEGAEDADTGLSLKTYLYLKRRIWRALRKRGESGQDSYAEMATAYLLSFTAADLGKEKTYWYYRYDYDNNTYNKEQRFDGALNYAWAAGQILYRGAEQVRFNEWALRYYFVGKKEGGAFLEIWARNPQCALRLMTESSCEPVALFGLHLLKEQTDFIRKLHPDILASFLASSFTPIARFGLEEVRNRIIDGEVTEELIAALLASELAEARSLGIKRIDQDVNWPWGAVRLAFLSVTSIFEDVQTKALKWLEERPVDAGQGEALSSQIISWLSGLGHTQLAEPDIARIQHLRNCLPLIWPERNFPAPLAEIEALIDHPTPEIIAVGLSLFAVSPGDPAQLSDAVWSRLLNSPEALIQSAALELFSQLNDEQLADRAFIIASATTAGSPQVRRAARPLVARLAKSLPRIGDDIAERLIDTLFQSAPDDDYVGDAISLFREALPDQLSSLEQGQIWRLLTAKAQGAQRLGAVAAELREPEIFSVRQLARLGNHADAGIRQWVMAAFDASPDRFQGDAANAVLLINSEWPDVYDFAMTTFEGWPVQVWTPDVLAIISDSTNPKVLDFARRLLRRLLSPGDSSGQLLRLLEHPATSMHLLVTELLTADAAKDDAMFAKLLPLARIVLLQVHKGRVAKDRIGRFLHETALANQAHAAEIAPIFTDLSLSILEADRSRAVFALRDIETTFPGLVSASPVERVELPVRSA